MGTVAALRHALRIVACAAAMLAVAAAAEERPRIGLVLGGGGARGGAHLGVLEVLEEMRVPVDCIAGTSMGALVGGAYAAGRSPAAIEDLVRRTDWIAIFDDTAGREAVDMRRKAMDERYFAGLEFGVSLQGFKFREGAVAGEKLKLFFNELVRSDLGDRPIEKLPLPISIIATDIGTGERVAIRTGNLTSAMRASMSVPGLIAPVLRDGRKLVDGGLTDNLPVAEAKALCDPDVLIVVNVGSPLLKPAEITGVVGVLAQVVNLLTEQNVAKSVALLTPRDVYIKPDLGDFSSTAFPDQLKAAEVGRAAARAAADSLKKYSMSRAVYAAWRDHVRLAAPSVPPVVDEVAVDSTRFVSAARIRRAISQKEGEPLDAERLARDLVREFSRGDLSALDYTVVRERDRTILRITPIEKAWGPDYLRFGVNLSSDFRTDSTYNVRALLRRTWLNPLGGEWLVGAQIGSEQMIATEFVQPMDRGQFSFVRPFASTSLRKLPLFFQGDRVAVYRVQDNRAGVEAGVNIGVTGQVRGGWVERRIGAVLDTGPDAFLNLTERVGGPIAGVSVDTYDQPFFPTRGLKGDVTYFDATRVSGTSSPYSRIEGRFGAAASHGRWTLLGGLEGGTALKGELPLAESFSLGGPRRLSGFAVDQMRGQDYAFGRAEAQYRLNFATPLYGLTFIAGVLAEAGRMNRPITETSLTGWQRSFGAYLAATTPIGPVYLGVADAKNGKGRFYLFIGTP
ncbi:MAG: patatin-like phospholipase family protein [Betaproteobacteria bacterium]